MLVQISIFVLSSVNLELFLSAHIFRQDRNQYMAMSPKFRILDIHFSLFLSFTRRAECFLQIIWCWRGRGIMVKRYLQFSYWLRCGYFHAHHIFENWLPPSLNYSRQITLTNVFDLFPLLPWTLSLKAPGPIFIYYQSELMLCTLLHSLSTLNRGENSVLNRMCTG